MLAAAEEPEQRHQEEQQREEGQESIEGKQGAQRAPAIVSELLDDPENEGGWSKPLLTPVESPHCLLNGIHARHRLGPSVFSNMPHSSVPQTRLYPFPARTTRMARYRGDR
jgi:hypothetical protein